MKIYEINSKDRTNLFFNKKSLDEFEPIGETNQDLDIYQVIKINDQVYSVSEKRLDNSYAFVEKIDLSNIEDELYEEDEIICPACRNSLSNSWEHADSNDNEECPYCGSIFSYERIVNPVYNMTLKKKCEVVEIKEILKQ